MSAKPSPLATVGLALWLAAAGVEANQERMARETRPSYPKSRAERSEVPNPEAGDLPDELRIAVPREPEGADTADREEHADLLRRARQAATWAADESIRRHGRPRYFEAGFHAGLHDGERRASNDRWEWETGRRDGRSDPEALALGREIGFEEAEMAAADDAMARVRQQFGDLSREPLPEAPPPPPRFTPAGFRIPQPELRDVFDDLPWRGGWGLDLHGLRLDPWRLHQSGRHGHDARSDWLGARFGLDLWRRPRSNSRWYGGLASEERGLFDQWFGDAFEAEVARRFDRVAEDAFERGYDAGWRYGNRVGREWQYRRGYHLGFEAAVREEAIGAFAGSFGRAWIRAYDDLFHEWSATVKLEARAVRLRDGNDDGVFEPGEELFAELELVNLGGASGRAVARIDGEIVEMAERREVELPPRAPVPDFRSLRAVIRSGARPGIESVVTVSVGELEADLPLRVSHVVTFAPRLRLLRHDVVGGTATVAVDLANASRRQVAVDLEASLPGAALAQPRRSLDKLAAGAHREVSFDISIARPLDLLAGNLVLTVSAATGGRPQGRLEVGLPELAVDLGDPGLADYLAHLARSPAVAPAEVERAHALTLRRMEADWDRVARAKGNLYKDDLRSGGSVTALGQLVLAARRAGGGVSHRAVFGALEPRIREISSTLPGNHPFLRRSLRKLARKLL